MWLESLKRWLKGDVADEVVPTVTFDSGLRVSVPAGAIGAALYGSNGRLIEEKAVDRRSVPAFIPASRKAADIPLGSGTAVRWTQSPHAVHFKDGRPAGISESKI